MRLQQPTRTTVACSALLFVLASCGERSSEHQGRRSHLAQHACVSVETPDVPPVVTMWDKGSMLANREPALLFAAWENGFVVHRVGDDLRKGWVADCQIAGLLERFRKIGLFGRSILREHLVTDGPEFLITAASGKEVFTLHYHGHDEWVLIDEISADASPSPFELRALIKRWREACDAIGTVIPRESEPFGEKIELKCPD